MRQLKKEQAGLTVARFSCRESQGEFFGAFLATLLSLWEPQREKTLGVSKLKRGN
jgi:hypothetical protein